MLINQQPLMQAPARMETRLLPAGVCRAGTRTAMGAPELQWVLGPHQPGTGTSSTAGAAAGIDVGQAAFVQGGTKASRVGVTERKFFSPKLHACKAPEAIR